MCVCDVMRKECESVSVERCIGKLKHVHVHVHACD